MKLAGRKIAIGNIVRKLIELTSLLPRFGIFTHPGHVLKLYLTKKNAPKFLELATGFKVYLSSHREDIVTTVVVFCKQDYGTDFAGKNIIDIGANIGAFSLFAAHKGAKKVVAIEPGKEAMETFRKSVQANKLQHVIIPVNAAVTSHDGDTLHFSTISSPNNTPAQNTSGTAAVPTTTLKTIINTHFTTPVDLLKVDCEGGEYDTFYHTDNETFARIRQIRMELHGATETKEALLTHLQQKGFKLDKYEHDNAWLTNTNA